MTFLPRFFLLLLLLAWGGKSQAFTSIPPADEDLFAAAETALVRVSPSGTHLASLVDGRRLTVQRRGRRGQRPIHTFDYGYLQGIDWATDERLVLRIRGPGQSFGLAAINRDGSDYRVLAAPGVSSASRAGAQLLDLVRGEPNSILIADDQRIPWAPDVLRVDVFDGQSEVVEQNPGRVIRWLTDSRGRVRLASAWRTGAEGPQIEVLYRTTGSQTWERVSSSSFSQGWWRPLSFASDGESFYVGTDRNRDTVAIQRYDLKTRKLDPPIFSHNKVDASSLLFSDHALPAVIPFDDGMPQLHFLDSGWRDLQRWVDRQQPRRTNRFTGWSSDSRFAVVFSYSDLNAGRYLLLDRSWQTLTPIGERHRSLANADLSKMELISFKAKDGLPLQGYLTRPLSGGPWPLVVIPHGGPWSRDIWGFSAVAQFFAARGMAVLSVNYRGSEGFGRSFLLAGRGEWGGLMQGDIDSGVEWAVRKGIAEPEKACLLGTSYGGYASLMGALLRPDLYRCAISIAGATDLSRQINRYKDVGNERAWLEWRYMVGDPAIDRQKLRRISPLHRAEDLQRPVLLFHGLADQTVPAEHSVSLAAKLESLNKPFELVLLPNTGHGLHHPETRLNVFRKAHSFIIESLSDGAAAESPE